MSHRTLIFLSLFATAVSAVAFRPPTMGWSSWNTFALNINEDVIRSQADAMVATGLDKAGYKYVNIDDGYWDGRGDDGHLRLNTKLFPSGMRALVDYIHSRGLKAGIYSDAGDNTCGSGNRQAWGLGVGLAGHEEQDCHLYFIDWDFDFIKVDFCGGRHMGLDEREQYTKISEAIQACGKKDVVFNVCRWAYPGTWISNVADSWRTTGDIQSQWWSVKKLILENLYLQAFTGGGHYNDVDMLEIGRTLLPAEEDTHMAYWCITSSPLLIGCDLTAIPQRSLELLKNPDLLAMNQDRLGLGAPVVQREGDVYVVAKDMEKLNGRKRAVVAVNLSDEEQTIALDLEAAGFSGKAEVYDCFTHSVVARAAVGSHAVSISAHGSAAFFITGKRAEKRIYQAEEAYLHAYQELGKVQSPDHQRHETAQQGVFVGFLGHSADNYLEWPNVYSRRGGNYTLRLRYASAEPRDLTLEVNGEERHTLEGLASGSWNAQWQTIDVSVKLRKGQNAIRLSNPDNWMPNIDAIELIAE